MRMLRNQPSVTVRHDLAVIIFPPCGILQVFHVVADRQYDLRRLPVLFRQIQCQPVRHLAYHRPALFKSIGFLKYLPLAHALHGRAQIFHIRHRTRLISPCMINQQLGVDTEQMIQQLFVFQRRPRHIAHGTDAAALQLSCDTGADAPEVRQRAVIPEQPPVAHLVTGGDPHTGAVRRNMLGHDVHRHLREIHIRADPGRGRDAGCFQDLTDHSLRQRPRIRSERAKIRRQLDENFIDRIGKNILRCHEFQIGAVNIRAVFHIQLHSRRCRDVVQLQTGILLQLIRLAGASGKIPDSRFCQSCAVDPADGLNHLEKSRPSGNPFSLQGRRNRQTDRFFRPRQIRHDKIRLQRIQSALVTLHRSVERFQVDGGIYVLRPSVRRNGRSVHVTFLLSFPSSFPALQAGFVGLTRRSPHRITLRVCGCGSLPAHIRILAMLRIAPCSYM